MKLRYNMNLKYQKRRALAQFAIFEIAVTSLMFLALII